MVNLPAGLLISNIKSLGFNWSAFKAFSTFLIMCILLCLAMPDPPNSTLQEQGLYRHEKTILLFTGLFLLQISARGSTFANSVIRFVLEEAAPDDFFKVCWQY